MTELDAGTRRRRTCKRAFIAFAILTVAVAVSASVALLCARPAGPAATLVRQPSASEDQTTVGGPAYRDRGPLVTTADGNRTGASASFGSPPLPLVAATDLRHIVGSSFNATVAGHGEERGLGAVTPETGTRDDGRRIKYTKMNRIADYPEVEPDRTMAAEKDGASVGYQNDLTPQNSGGYGSKEDADNPEALWSGSVLGESGGWYRPPYGIEDQYPAAGHEYNYGHKTPPPNGLTKIYHQKHKETAIDWRKVGALALVKLGLAKLQAIGFLKILFLLGSKLVVFVKAMLFKFAMIMKLMKFLKVLLLPFLALKLLPTLAQLFDLARRPLNNTIGSPGLNTLANLPGGLLPSRPGITTGTTGTDILGGITGNRLPGVNTGLSGIGNRPAGTIGKLDDQNLIDEQYYEPLELFDPTLAIFQKVLDSEKCVERIACQIAAAQNAGVMPFWINWMLYRISKFVPNEKLESYLKTYKDVNNKIHTKSSTLNNWATWCSEHYDCSNNNITNKK